VNNERRKRLSDLRSKLEELKSDVESIKDEEQDYHDNMPEAFQQGDKGDAATAAIDHLETAENLLDEAISAIEESES
jgi:uncharacterized coiled-coil DUF342 family protein